MKRAVQLFLVVCPKGRLCPSGAVGTGRFLKQGMPQYGQERHLFFFRGKNKNKKQKTPKQQQQQQNRLTVFHKRLSSNK